MRVSPQAGLIFRHAPASGRTVHQYGARLSKTVHQCGSRLRPDCSPVRLPPQAGLFFGIDRVSQRSPSRSLAR